MREIYYLFSALREYKAWVWVGDPVLGVREFSSPRYPISQLLATRGAVGLNRAS